MSCGVGWRRGADPELLWLLCRPAGEAQNFPRAWNRRMLSVKTKKKKKTKKEINQSIKIKEIGKSL